MLWVQTVMNGALLGSLYALFGLGFAFAFGIIRIVNVAQGEFIVLSAFISLFLLTYIQINPLFMLVPIAVILFAVGYFMQSTLLNRVLGADPLPGLMITFGVSITLRNAMSEFFGADNRRIDAGWLNLAGFDFMGLRFGVLSLVILAVTLVLFIGLHLIMSKTSFGRIVRATADDFEIVQLFGVNYARIYCISMGISLALASSAGLLIAMRSSFTPFSGVDRLLLAFEVVIIGGLGSIWGMFVGGIILGVTQLVGLNFNPNSGLLYTHIVFFLILMIAPKGLASWRA